jgi:hypothetical protein
MREQMDRMEDRLYHLELVDVTRERVSVGLRHLTFSEREETYRSHLG